MNKDWLEKFIFENREDFDMHKAPPLAWESVERGLNQKPKVKKLHLTWYTMAAGFVGVLAAGMLLGKFYFSNNIRSLDHEVVNAIMKTEEHYNKEVNLKLQTLKSTNLYNKDLQTQLDKLDEVYDDLKNDMIKHKDINNDIILAEMVKNYQLKISLLEHMMSLQPQTNTKLKPNPNTKWKDTI